MRKIAALALVLCALITLQGFAAAKKTTPKKKKVMGGTTVACPASLKGIGDCPPEGCGQDIDPNLNKQKNILPDDPRTKGDAEAHDVTWMKNLADPKNFTKGGPRDELAGIGEGKKVRIFGYVLTIRGEGGESCNCKLTDKDDQVAVNTDNHLVVVDAPTVAKFKLPNGADVTAWKSVLAKREPVSITAEFTPHVRFAHPNFTRANVSPLILASRQDALPVRLTGMLMFDSEHFIENHLNRATNWEVHPILKFEYCPKGATCTADSDDGWKSLDDLSK